MYNLDALVKRLRDGGTLLILDFQKATTQTKIGLNGLKEGHKPNGYHSDTLVDVLKHLSMDVDVIDGLRFQWVRSLYFSFFESRNSNHSCPLSISLLGSPLQELAVRNPIPW